MKKYYPHFIAGLFCVFLFGFGAAFFLLPDKDFSEQENRFLASFIPPTSKTLVSGKFMKDFEDYVTDQFPLRDSWIRLNTGCERLAGKQENSGVYFGTDGGQTLFAQFAAPGREELEKRVGYVNRLAANLEVPVYFALVPDKSWVWADRLPAGAPAVDDGSTLNGAEELTDGPVWVDLRGAIGGDSAFYRTDHHWSTDGAMQAYNALADAMLEQGSPTGDGQYAVLEKTVRSSGFYGTTWSACGAAWVQPDEIYTMIPEGGTKGHTTVAWYPGAAPVEGRMYDLDQLKIKDKYKFFLGGNQPLCVLQNPDAAGGKLLVIRDSYADSLAPFLSERWREVHLFDLRYNRTPLTQYAAENAIDQVLVLYSAANFSSDDNLFLMSR